METKQGSAKPKLKPFLILALIASLSIVGFQYWQKEQDKKEETRQRNEYFAKMSDFIRQAAHFSHEVVQGIGEREFGTTHSQLLYDWKRLDLPVRQINKEISAHIERAFSCYIAIITIRWARQDIVKVSESSERDKDATEKRDAMIIAAAGSVIYVSGKEAFDKLDFVNSLFSYDRTKELIRAFSLLARKEFDDADALLQTLKKNSSL